MAYVHGVLRVLVRQEPLDLDDGGDEAAADVPPGRRRLRLGQEHLGTAQVVQVHDGHPSKHPLK